jgi:flagellum-specific peptidoglycan hydrolase FlgJ
MNKVTYTPFIPEYKIPEASANLPVQLLRPAETTVDLTPAFPTETKAEEPTKEESTVVTQSDAQPESKITWSAAKPIITGTYSDNKKFVSDLTSAYEKELEARGLSKDYAKYIVAQDALESN